MREGVEEGHPRLLERPQASCGRAARLEAAGGALRGAQARPEPPDRPGRRMGRRRRTGETPRFQAAGWPARARAGADRRPTGRSPRVRRTRPRRRPRSVLPTRGARTRVSRGRGCARPAARGGVRGRRCAHADGAGVGEEEQEEGGGDADEPDRARNGARARQVPLLGRGRRHDAVVRDRHDRAVVEDRDDADDEDGDLEVLPADGQEEEEEDLDRARDAVRACRARARSAAQRAVSSGRSARQLSPGPATRRFSAAGLLGAGGVGGYRAAGGAQ